MTNEELDLLERRLDEIEKQNNDQSEALMLMMLDRIQYIGNSYIAKGEVSFENRRQLHAMYKCYHTRLGGNGDADWVMSAVDELPTKGQKKEATP